MASLALSLDYSHVLSAWEEMGGAAFADGDSAILDAKDPGAVTLDLSSWEARLKPLAAAVPPPPLDATVPAHMNIFAPFFLPPDQLALSYLQPGAVPSASPTASAASAFPMPFGACCGMPPFPFMPPAWPPAAAPAMPTTSSDSGAQVVPVCPSPSTAAAPAASKPSPCSSADGDASNQGAPVTSPSPSDPVHGDQHDTSRQQDCVMREEAGCGSANPADAPATAPATSSMSGPEPDHDMGTSDHDFALDMGMIHMMQFGDFDVNAMAAADAAAASGDAAESANAVSTAPGSPCLSTRTSELGVVPDLAPADAHACATSPPGLASEDASRSHSPVPGAEQPQAAAAPIPVPGPAPATALPSATFPFLAAALAAQAVAAAGGALSRTKSTPLCGTPASFVPVAQAPALARSQSLTSCLGNAQSTAIKAEPVAVAPCGPSVAEPEGPAAAAVVPQPATRAAAASIPAAPPTAPAPASGTAGSGGAQFYRTRAEALERYRQKKARRHYQKKIRYQLRKINADKRPRIKGRFVKKEELEEFLAARQQQQGAVGGGGGLCSDLAGAAAMFEDVDDADAVLGLGLGFGLESDEE